MLSKWRKTGRALLAFPENLSIHPRLVIFIYIYTHMYICVQHTLVNTVILHHGYHIRVVKLLSNARRKRLPLRIICRCVRGWIDLPGSDVGFVGCLVGLKGWVFFAKKRVGTKNAGVGCVSTLTASASGIVSQRVSKITQNPSCQLFFCKIMDLEI